MRSSIDTNIALYAFADLADPEKTVIARDLIRQLAESNECVISAQVLKEFANVCTKRLRPLVSQPLLIAQLQQLALLNLVIVDEALTIAAVNRHFASQISFYDALIVESSIAGEAEVLYSEDMQHGMRFGSLRVVNPFLLFRAAQ